MSALASVSIDLWAISGAMVKEIKMIALLYEMHESRCIKETIGKLLRSKGPENLTIADLWHRTQTCGGI